MASAESVVRLRHGTTRQRAEAILRDGPNPNFVEPGGLYPDGGFHVAPAEGASWSGSPEEYAIRKAAIFADEGGPAVVEIEVPESIARMSIDAGGDMRFERGCGLDELLQAWASLTKRLIPL